MSLQGENPIMQTSTSTTLRSLVRGLRSTAALAFCLVLLLAPRGWAGRRLDLTLLHTNDIHGHMLPYDYGDQTDVGGAARRATLIDQIKRETHHPVLLIDSGDVVTRGPLWTEFEGKLDIDVMNALGYDLAAIGNNEFKVRADRSAQGVLLDLVRRSHFPWLAANAFDGTGAYLPGVQPYLVRKIDGVRVAFLGLTAPRSATYPQTVGWKITDPIEAARALLPRIRRESDVIIALTHIGYGLDLDLAGEDSDLDAIVGGDSHTYLPAMTLVQRPRDPLQTVPSRRLGIPVVQDGEFGHDLGRLDLHFEQTGSGAWELRAAEWHTIPITASLPERPDVASMLQRAAAPLRRPVGRVQVPGSTVAERELATRRLIAQALKEETGADIGLEPADSLFGIWKTGPISAYDVRYVLPFPNHAVVVSVRGSDLLQALTLPGMAIAGAEVGSSASVPGPEVRVAGAPLDADRTYRVAAEDYHALETPGLKGAPADTRGDVRDLVVQWLRQGRGQQVGAGAIAPGARP
jgi:2',3'-cyclic-nucleotide 2'-phosphodiesterase (5'-nucleotidase family)